MAARLRLSPHYSTLAKWMAQANRRFDEKTSRNDSRLAASDDDDKLSSSLRW